MSVKKLLTLTAVGAATVGVATAALAGGPEYAPAESHTGVYLEGGIGFAARDWVKDGTTPIGFIDSANLIASSSNTRSGFTFSPVVGYQFNKYISAEAGWVYLPHAKVTTKPIGDIGAGTLKFNSGIVYGAAKLSVPVYENTYIFGKFGIGYVYNEVRGSGTASGSDSTDYAKPVWAAGVQYYFTQNLSVNFQYMNVAGRHRESSLDSSEFNTPDAHLFTVGVGYKFLM